MIAVRQPSRLARLKANPLAVLVTIAAAAIPMLLVASLAETTGTMQGSLDTKYAFCREHAPLLLGEHCGAGTSGMAASALWALFGLMAASACVFGYASAVIFVKGEDQEDQQVSTRKYLVTLGVLVAVGLLSYWLQTIVVQKL